LASPAKLRQNHQDRSFLDRLKTPGQDFCQEYSHKILLQIPLGVNIKFDVNGKFYMLINFLNKMPGAETKKAHHLHAW
jgi:hypothetical protein